MAANEQDYGKAGLKGILAGHTAQPPSQDQNIPVSINPAKYFSNLLLNEDDRLSTISLGNLDTR